MVGVVDGTVCPGSRDPFHIVSDYINGQLLLGQTVVSAEPNLGGSLASAVIFTPFFEDIKVFSIS